jgi:hypothetical protein
MLRSRVENRPNSSVTDFRRQLSTLQSTSTPRMRTIGRPLAPSPLQRPAASGRPGHPHHRQAAVHGSTATRQRHAASRSADAGSSRAGQPTFRSHGSHDHAHRQTHMERPDRSARPNDPRTAVRRRRSNVLFLLVITTACTLFLAATTSSTAMLYVFALAFLALCGYVYLLAQLRQREAAGWDDGWLEHR